MNNVKIAPSNLRGKIKIPPSKSLCHRAIIAAGLSNGVCNIDNVIFSDDIATTCNGMQSLGAYISRKNNTVIVKASGFLDIVNNEIDCLESGSTLRFLIPLALLTNEKITFTGKGRLSQRPLSEYYKIFDEQGIEYSTKAGLPITIRGMLNANEYKIAGNISSQFVTGLMFALPLLHGDSKIIITTELESSSYVDLTINSLKKFGIDIENNNYREFYIRGNQKYFSTDYRVEGDFSQAAFWLAAGILGGEVECMDIDINSLQGDRVIVEFIEKMGGNIKKDKEEIIAKSSFTKGITMDVSNCPDLVPILAVIAALSQGTTEIKNAGRLRIKESDRLKAISTELKKLGANISETNDGLIIHGKKVLNGGTVDSWNDHRIAMALSIASIRCREPVIIKNSGAVKKSYPEFYKDFMMLGGKINEWSMG